MKRIILAVGLLFASLLWVNVAYAQTIHTTNVTVVYSNNQSDSFFENVTQFSFSGDNLLINQNGTVTPISRSIIRKLTLEDVTSSSIETYDENARIFIYPNPTSSSATISVTGVNGKVRIAVVDMNGREVRSETLECTNDCEKTMDVENLAQGAYFVRITGENVNMVRKLVVR